MLLFVACCLLCVVCYLVFVVWRLMSVVLGRRSLCVARCFLWGCFVVCVSLIVRCLLFVAFLVIRVPSLLFVVCCSLSA